jgi:hypothetical protein
MSTNRSGDPSVVTTGALAPRPVADGDGPSAETVGQPGKLLRIGAMAKQLLDEIRQTPLDEASRVRLREIHEISIRELSESLSPELRDELGRVTPPFTDSGAPSEAELRVAQAQLVGWLEGLFQGIQATLFAQQMAARGQLEEMRGRSVTPASEEPAPRTGTYL